MGCYRFPLFLFLALCACGYAKEQTLKQSPQRIQKQLLQIYQQQRQTFLCATPFSTNGLTRDEGAQIKAMPVVLPKEYAKDLLCYREKICIDKNGKAYKGLKCCETTDTLYQTMKKDLHNLVPEIASMIKKRGNKHFGQCEVQSDEIKECHLKLDKKHKIIEPPEALRGMIARSYLYMAQTYPITLSTQDKALYLAWHQAFPPSAFEKERNERIKALQGNSNPYID